jgi:hypothetical protein
MSNEYNNDSIVDNVSGTQENAATVQKRAKQQIRQLELPIIQKNLYENAERAVIQDPVQQKHDQATTSNYVLTNKSRTVTTDSKPQGSTLSPVVSPTYINRSQSSFTNQYTQKPYNTTLQNTMTKYMTTNEVVNNTDTSDTTIPTRSTTTSIDETLNHHNTSLAIQQPNIISTKQVRYL